MADRNRIWSYFLVFLITVSISFLKPIKSIWSASSRTKQPILLISIDILSLDSNNDIPDLIDQVFIQTTDRNKFEDFCRVIDEDRPFMAIVFCRTKARVDKLELQMGQAGYNCKKIHSDISQNKREKIIKDFRDLKIQFLISTDLSSRGLDIGGITHIYNYDFPERVEDYVHRVGRSGRLGKEGKATSMVTEKNMTVYEEVKNL